MMRMRKQHARIWRTGLLIGKFWISWYKGLHVYKRQPNSNLSRAYNFYA